MDRGSEKTGALIATATGALDALAAASVLVSLAGAAAAAFSSPATWKAFAYFSTAAALFDLVFTVEYLVTVVARGVRRVPLHGLSSVLPLLLVSGPFLAGLSAGDFGAAAVRGFWLASPPINALAAASALRLLRLVRVAKAFAAGPGRAAAPYKLAAAVGLAIVVLGAAAIDALSLPGPSRLSRERRRVAVELVATASGTSAKAEAARTSGALAASDGGDVLFGAPPDVFPGDVAVAEAKDVRAWFSVSGDARARGVAAALAVVAAIAASLAYAYAAGRSRARDLSGSYSDSDQRQDSRHRPADAPAGDEELAGILGKRAP